MDVTVLFTLSLLACCGSALATIGHEDTEFQKWLIDYKIQAEDPKQIYPVWKKNAEFVQYQNSLGLSYTVSLNQLAHLTTKELMNRNAIRLATTPSTQENARPYSGPLPSSVDWREKGAVTPVHNQGQIGYGSAFAIVDSVASFGFIKTGKLVQPSVEEFVQCCLKDSGIFGTIGYNCIAKLGGLACDYPNTTGTCHSKDVKPCVDITGGKTVTPFGDEKALAAALVHQPIAVAIDAGHRSFQMYREGVYYEPDCSSTKLDHAVLLVGYGTDNGEDYWLIKNSWGPEWGMKGYMMMARNRGNSCGIATDAIYPY